MLPEEEEVGSVGAVSSSVSALSLSLLSSTDPRPFRPLHCLTFLPRFWVAAAAAEIAIGDEGSGAADLGAIFDAGCIMEAGACVRCMLLLQEVIEI